MDSSPSYSRETTAISEITGKPVNTWSEEWRAECEARTVLAMSPADRHAYFNGRKGAGGRDRKGIEEIRGKAGADILRGYVARLEEVRSIRRVG